VEEYVVRWVEHVAFGLNDGRKLERLLERVQQEGGTLNLPRPADVQDYAQPVSPRATLPVGFR
jgi:hypothetical protein